MKLLPAEKYYKPSFKILQCYSKNHMLGRYKDFSIDIYKTDNSRAISVSKAGQWLGARITQIKDGIKQVFYKF